MKRAKAKTIYVGIDPGQQGAYAAVTETGTAVAVHTPFKQKRQRLNKRDKRGRYKYRVVDSNYDFREIFKFFRWLKKLESSGTRIVVAIERQCTRPTDAKQVCFMVGRNQMLWEAMAGALGFKPRLIMPTAWKPKYVSKGATKAESVRVCKKLYPEVDLPLAKDEARAEAILIADYVRRQEAKLPYLR